MTVFAAPIIRAWGVHRHVHALPDFHVASAGVAGGQDDPLCAPQVWGRRGEKSCRQRKPRASSASFPESLAL